MKNILNRLGDYLIRSGIINPDGRVGSFTEWYVPIVTAFFVITKLTCWLIGINILYAYWVFPIILPFAIILFLMDCRINHLADVIDQHPIKTEWWINVMVVGLCLNFIRDFL